MRCLCCGEIIDENSQNELEMQWHERCVKDFFGTVNLPELKITKEELEKLVSINVNNGLTIPGVQKKMSLHLEKDTPARLTLVGYPTGYIMKPQANEYNNLPEFEWVAMRIAEKAGIKVVPFALYRNNDELVYLTRRIDRQVKDGQLLKYAMEDFCQLSERLVEDKYKGSYESCIRIVQRYSANFGLDISELFLRVLISYIVGNSDLHLKNFSLRETEPGIRKFILSDAYDILPVNMVEPRDLDEMALSLNGKKRDLSLEDFLKFADYCGVGGDAGKKMVKKICEKENDFLDIIDNSPLNDSQKEKMCELIKNRCKNLTMSF